MLAACGGCALLPPPYAVLAAEAAAARGVEGGRRDGRYLAKDSASSNSSSMGLTVCPIPGASAVTAAESHFGRKLAEAAQEPITLCDRDELVRVQGHFAHKMRSS